MKVITVNDKTWDLINQIHLDFLTYKDAQKNQIRMYSWVLCSGMGRKWSTISIPQFKTFTKNPNILVVIGQLNDRERKVLVLHVERVGFKNQSQSLSHLTLTPSQVAQWSWQKTLNSFENKHKHKQTLLLIFIAPWRWHSKKLKIINLWLRKYKHFFFTVAVKCTKKQVSLGKEVAKWVLSWHAGGKGFFEVLIILLDFGHE